MKFLDYQLMSKEIKNKIVPKLRFEEFKGSGEWEEKKLEDYIDLFSGIPLKSEELIDNESGIRILRGINITEGYIRHSKDIDKYFLGDLENLEKYLVKENDIVIGMDGSKVGKNVAMITKEDENSILIQRVARIRSNKDADINFIYQYFISDKFRSYVDTVNTSSGIPHISAQQIKDSKVGFPPKIKEQQKIADCLSSLDDLISAENQKLDALKVHKKGLMQQLFPAEGDASTGSALPKLRFKEFEESGEWRVRELQEFIFERTSNSTNETPLYSLTIENGVTPKTERYERSFLVMNEEDAYKLVCPNDFAYNPMNLRFGAIARYCGNKKVALSKYYNIFYCDDSVDSIFCEFYFKSYGMIKHYNDIATGTLVEKRRVHFSDFLKLKINFPKLQEQQKIAKCLSSLDELITARIEKIESLKLHKKGLMQGMFPSMESFTKFHFIKVSLH